MYFGTEWVYKGKGDRIIIAGSEKSGSGTIIGAAVSFSILSGKPDRVTHIRTKRDKPGLRPQYLKATGQIF